MENIKVELLHYTPIEIAIDAIRTCWDSGSKKDSCYKDEEFIVGDADCRLVDNIVNHHKHHSTVEHLCFNFFIKGISRSVLQQLCRHRIASYSVESTRYTIKKHLKNEEEFKENDFTRASKYVVLGIDKEVNLEVVKTLENVRKLCIANKSNDTIKYALPEAFRTNLYWTINARSLRNFLELRTSKHALLEIKILATKIYESLPDLYKKLLFKDVVKELNVMWTEDNKNVSENKETKKEVEKVKPISKQNTKKSYKTNVKKEKLLKKLKEIINDDEKVAEEAIKKVKSVSKQNTKKSSKANTKKVKVDTKAVSKTNITKKEVDNKIKYKLSDLVQSKLERDSVCKFFKRNFSDVYNNQRNLINNSKAFTLEDYFFMINESLKLKNKDGFKYKSVILNLKKELNKLKSKKSK